MELPNWISLLLLSFLVMIGYTGMIWAVGGGSLYNAYLVSGSSLLTLGFASSDSLPTTILGFTEATIGLILVALLIAYLPSMYSAFSRRESAVSMLEVRAGSPPFAVEMLARYNRIHGLDKLAQQWETWEMWFTDIEESHTSLAALVFFRSPKPEHSWVTAAGAVLDAASLARSSIEIPPDPRADLCIRAGYLALRHITDYFSYPYNPNPHFPEQPISLTREDYDRGMDTLAGRGGSGAAGDAAQSARGARSGGSVELRRPRRRARALLRARADAFAAAAGHGVLGALLALALLRALVCDYARVATLILAGVALNTFAGAAIALALNLAPSPYAMHEIVYWLMGSVANRSFAELAFSVPFMLLALALLFSTRNYLEALSLGEDTAHTLGFGARSFPWRVMGGVAIGVGAAVAISIVGFLARRMMSAVS